MKLLHLFAGPFPTVQGTQVLIRQTCGLLAEAGHNVHLLCYAHRAEDTDTPFKIHRIPDKPKFRSERSVPTGRKLLLDLSLARTASKLIKELDPDIIHAHHYEALVAAKLADPTGKLPLVFHMHALFGPELPTYLPSADKSSPLRRIPENFAFRAGGYVVEKVGRAIDTLLPNLADGIAAVDISLVEHLRTIGSAEDKVALVRPPAVPPAPVPVPPCGSVPEKARVKAVYIGNLDRYQGLDNLLSGLTHLDAGLKDRLRVDIVTASEPTDFKSEVNRRGLDHLVRIVPHHTPTEAWQQLVRTDFVVVPRTLTGGAPIKLINALEAGRPTLVDKTLGKELDSGRETYAVDMKNPSEVAKAIGCLVTDENLRKTLSQGALEAADRLYSPRKSLQALERLYEKVL
jgi:glycosyltransferase involved in cell wall biosynthesis